MHLSDFFYLRDVVDALNTLSLEVFCQLWLRVAILGHKPQFLRFLLQLCIFNLGSQEIFVKFEGKIDPILLLTLEISCFVSEIRHQLVDMNLACSYVPFEYLRISILWVDLQLTPFQRPTLTPLRLIRILVFVFLLLHCFPPCLHHWLYKHRHLPHFMLGVSPIHLINQTVVAECPETLPHLHPWRALQHCFRDYSSL